MLLQKINKVIGFTLIELMVTVFIIAIFAAICIPVVVAIFSNSNSKTEIVIEQPKESSQIEKEAEGKKL